MEKSVAIEAIQPLSTARKDKSWKVRHAASHALKKINFARLEFVLKEQSPQELLPLFSEYSNRMRMSGAHIWTIGSIFIPLSLTGIAFGTDEPIHTIAIGTFSILLIWIWYVISIRLREALERDFRVLTAIENALLKIDPPCKKYGIGEMVSIEPSKWETRVSETMIGDVFAGILNFFIKPGLRQIRIGIPTVVTIAWLVVMYFSYYEKGF